MKFSSKYRFIIKIIVLVLLSLLGAWLSLKTLYFSATLVFLLIVSLSVLLYYDRRKMIDKMERMIAGIRHSDFSYHYTDTESKDELNHLYREMNEALEIFRNRTQHSMMDEAETQAWQKLISVLTHEIMNSIAPIISLSETLSERKISNVTTAEEYHIMKQAMETIHRRSKGLLSFVENYRKLTRIPAPTRQPIRLKLMLKSLQQLVFSDGIHFSYTVYPENLILNADRNMLEQALINLIKNAHEASIEVQNRKIEIKAAQMGSEIHISVFDNGTGISPKALEKIFIPFYSTKKQGSGIGLSLSRQIMIRHKGKISVKSNKKGSVFTMVFEKGL